MPTKAETKPFTSFEEQIGLLRTRGLAIENESFALEVLQKINYYRLSAYSLTFRENDRFYHGYTFENMVELYNFDAEFRSIIMKYSATVEHAFRTHIAYHHAEKYGSTGYLCNAYFEDELRHSKFLTKLFSLIDRSDDIFIRHHKEDRNGVYPFWVAIEVTSFDVLSKLYKNLLPDMRTTIAKTYYSVHRKYIENWLQCSVVARNISAHGGRFYNRYLTSPVKLDVATNLKVNNRTAFAVVFAIYRLLPTNAERHQLIKDLKDLFYNHQFVLRNRMGFPDCWDGLLEDQMILQ